MKDMIFSFGGAERERLEIEITRYEYELASDYHDLNWLLTEARIQVGGFKGKIQCTIQTVELSSFAEQVRTLLQTLRGTAKFRTLEEQITLDLKGDGKGHIELSGRLEDEAGIGNCLEFTLNLDQTFLARSLHELEAVSARFPVRLAANR